MSALEKFIQHTDDCEYQKWWKEGTICTCGYREAETELLALQERVKQLEDALLISGNLIVDTKKFLEIEIKVTGGVGMEYEVGLLDDFDAFLDLHGNLVKELGEKHERENK